MEILFLVGLLIALAILLLFIGVGKAWEQVSSNRIDDYIGEQLARSRTPTARRTTRLSESASEMVQGIDKILRSLSILDALAYALQRGGLKLTVTEYLGIWLLCVTSGAALGYVISRNLWTTLVTAILGGVLPHIVVRLREATRLHAFNTQLGNVLMQLSGSMKAGYGLLQALDFVSREMPAPAGPEFAQVVRDVKLGLSLMDALDNLANRLGSEDLMLIITAIRIQHDTGGNLSEILETVAHTIRERVRIKGELRSLTAQQRYSGYVLAALPIIMFFVLMVLNPEYESRLFSPGLTLCIPIGALLSMIVGIFVIQRIVAIEV